DVGGEHAAAAERRVQDAAREKATVLQGFEAGPEPQGRNRKALCPWHGIALLLPAGLLRKDRAQSPRPQGQRRGEAGPVHTGRHVVQFDRGYFNIPRTASASARKRRSSSRRGRSFSSVSWFLFIHPSARSNHLRASSRWPSRPWAIARKRQSW